MGIESFDDKESYCRRLGHFLFFKYCRAEKDSLPCPKIFDCWFEKIPVQDFIDQNFKKEDVSYIFNTSKPKITSIIEMIEQAKKLQNL